MNDHIKSQKPLVIIGPALMPIIGGAIIYYGLRHYNLPMAKLGNRVSWLAFFGYGLVGLVLPSWVLEWVNTAWLGIPMVLGGIVVSSVAVGNIRRGTKDYVWGK